MSVRDKWVRRFSIDETAKHKNGFTIYKITSVLFPLESPEAVTVVSVWKRYSDVQRLHKSMRSLHAGLHLRGTFPTLTKSSFFKRFQQEIIDERAKSIKTLLEFVAEHRLLFASTDFVNFLQTGYPEPEPKTSVINAIRSSLHLPIEETPPLEYQTSDDDTRSPPRSARSVQETSLGGRTNTVSPTTELDVSQIPIYEAADVEIRESPKTVSKLSAADSFESLSSLRSIDFDLYDEVSKMTVERCNPSVRSKVLPDLITFDAPSTSKFEDYHTMRQTSGELDASSLGSTACESCDGESRRSVPSLSLAESRTRTEDSYIFEAGYMLNLAARCENTGEHRRAFDYYKAGIEKMLIGVQSDSDPERRAVVKQKTNKYLSYAEAIYKNHLCDADLDLAVVCEREEAPRALHCPIPLSMLRRSYEELAQYRVLAVLGDSTMLVHHKEDQACYAMKVVQKVPANLTEFEGYFQQRAGDARRPVLPTVIPYMVPLHALVETDHLYFLILAYAPGKKLFEYIKSYADSVRPAPARTVNLENVFTEPKKRIDIENDNVDVVDSTASVSVGAEYLDSVNENVVDSAVSDGDVSVNDLVINSQKLLLNVDRVLSETSVVGERKRDDNAEVEEASEMEDVERVASRCCTRLTSNPRELLPPSAVCKWGAEILTALESLHNYGVVCRDLNPSNILLGEQGQIILTYFLYYPGVDMALAQLRRRSARSPYVAPELLARTFEDGGEVMERVCDFWSFGALMYELLCGLPLSQQHGEFTSHTVLQLPDGLSVEERSLLEQLLTYEPSERLGAGGAGIAEIKHHPYFRHVDWRALHDGWLVPD